MPTFGFSAFLKLLSLAPKPQRREVKQRFIPSDSGYDFHRSLRLRARRLIVAKEDLQDLIDEASTIKQASERRSLVAGLSQLDAWRAVSPGSAIEVASSIYTSPTGAFKVAYQPDFGWILGGQRVAIHVWNTGAPNLVPRMTYAALWMARAGYTESIPPDDVAVLSLPEARLYRLSDVSDQARLASIIAAEIENVFENVRDEFEREKGKGGPEDRPPR